VLTLVAQDVGLITHLDDVIEGLAAQPTVAEDCLWPLN
jgi:hypothetical protein